MVGEGKKGQFIDNAPVGRCLITANGIVQDADAVVCHILKITAADQTPTIFEFVAPEDLHLLEKFLHQKSPVEDLNSWLPLHLNDREGAEKTVLVKVVSRKDGGANLLELVLLPVFERYFHQPLFSIDQIPFSFAVSQDKYQTIFESATIGIAIINAKGRIVECNKVLAGMMGATREALINQSFADLNLGDDDSLVNFHERINTGQTDSIKHEVIIGSPEQPQKILMVSLSYIDDLDAVMMIAEDITERENAQKALLQSEKLSLTGRLAASLAHEINNPLQTSIGCLGLAEEMLDEDQSDLRDYLQMAIDELRRSARIVKKLRDLNQPVRARDYQPVDIRELIEDVILITQSRLRDKGITTVMHPSNAKNRTNIYGSQDQLQQVFLNIILNAVDVMSSGGKIDITLSQTQSPEGLRIKIRDNGPGISADHLGHLFDPFFTTKVDGLGLGLYICQQIIEDHNGEISAKNEEEKGAAFLIWLPSGKPNMQKESKL